LKIEFKNVTGKLKKYQWWQKCKKRFYKNKKIYKKNYKIFDLKRDELKWLAILLGFSLSSHFG
jgi:hypothetical protein